MLIEAQYTDKDSAVHVCHVNNIALNPLNTATMTGVTKTGDKDVSRKFRVFGTTPITRAMRTDAAKEAALDAIVTGAAPNTIAVTEAADGTHSATVGGADLAGLINTALA